MTLAETFAQQLNSSECSTIAGTYIGLFQGIKITYYVIISYFILKAIDRLAYEPLLNWVKSKLYKGGKKNGTDKDR